MSPHHMRIRPCTSFQSPSHPPSLAFTASAGPLDPPGGPVSPTMKTLQQVEPRTPVNSDTCPGDATSEFRIQQAGSYYLTSDIHAADGRSAIKIEASGVTLDLNGFTVVGVPGHSTIFTTTGHVTVKNGRIRLGKVGLHVQGNFAHAENLRVETTDEAGILVGQTSTIRNCVAWFSGGNGITASAQSQVEKCTVDSVSGNGVNVGPNSIVTETTVRDADGTGIVTNINCVVRDCTAISSGLDGLYLSAGTIVKDCTTFLNVNNGFVTGGRVMISDCMSRSNGLAGFRLGGPGVIKGCFASDNQQGIRSEIGLGQLILENDCSDNTGHGIWMNGAKSCRIEGNQCYSNGSSGIFLVANGSHLVIRNTARGNGGADFSFEPSSDYGQVITDPGAGFVNFNAWSNISY